MITPEPASARVEPSLWPLPVRRVFQRLSMMPWFARVASRIFPQLDRFLLRVSGGRFLFSERVVPTVVLITTGARSGTLRETPLAAMTDGADGFYVCGSNFGQPHHPAWTQNLLAEPSSVLWHAGTRVPVRARLIEGVERSELWPRLVAMWPGWPTYEERSGRRIRVFHLEPTGPPLGKARRLP